MPWVAGRPQLKNWPKPGPDLLEALRDRSVFIIAAAQREIKPITGIELRPEDYPKRTYQSLCRVVNSIKGMQSNIT